MLPSFLVFRFFLCVQFVHHDIGVGIHINGVVGVVDDHAGLGAGGTLDLLHGGHVHGNVFAQTLQSSLTLQNSSSSEFTLTCMSIVSLIIPFVVAYIAYFWRKMDIRSITTEELKETETY